MPPSTQPWQRDPGPLRVRRQSPKALTPCALHAGAALTYEADAVVLAVGITAMQRLVQSNPALGSRAEFQAFMDLRAIDVLATRLFFDKCAPALLTCVVCVCLDTSAGPEPSYRAYQTPRSTKAREPEHMHRCTDTSLTCVCSRGASAGPGPSNRGAHEIRHAAGGACCSVCEGGADGGRRFGGWFVVAGACQRATRPTC